MVPIGSNFELSKLATLLELFQQIFQSPYPHFRKNYLSTSPFKDHFQFTVIHMYVFMYGWMDI